MRLLGCALLLASSVFGQALFRAQNHAATATGPITVDNHTAIAGGVNGGTSSPDITVAGNFIAIVVNCYDAINPCAVSDSKSQTYSCGTYYGGSNRKTAICIKENAAPGSGYNFTVSGVSTFSRGYVISLNNVKTSSSADGSETGSGSSGGGGHTMTPGSITPSQNGSVCLTGFSNDDGSNAPTVTSPFTVYDENHAGVEVEGGGAYSIQTTATASDPVWTSGATAYGGVQACFKKAP